ncbi:hypothetical protein BC629DRAFT_1455920 [Irpex lacteus]|nr:hypothetical protein BC629DRAFT_1455920 [Irpex lacteus]
MRLLITGATGLAGLNVYRAALEDPTVSSITLLMRRDMPSWAVLPENASVKTTTIVHKDFTTYQPDLAAQLIQHDACLWTLGNRQRNGEDEYTVCRGRRGKSGRPTVQVLYWSGERADPSGNSSMMWARVKGRTEAEIMNISKSTPGLHLPNQRSRFESGADRILSPALSLLAPTRMITVEQMARAALEIAKGKHADVDLFRCKALLDVASWIDAL